MNKLLTYVFFIFSCFLLIIISSTAQNLAGGTLHGNFQLDAQYYVTDSAIGAPNVPEKMLSNGFANFLYENTNFTAGLRYENYTNPLLGFDPRYKGNGIPYRFLDYKNNELQITAGNFYDQFGSGLIFRTYEERSLGYDNAMDGLRLKYNPVAGIYFKGLIGYQRDFFTKGAGIVRGADAEWNLNESLKGWGNRKTKFIIGGSFVSKYQDDQDPVYILPKNVGTGGGRITVIHGNLNLYGEFAYKANDPSVTNGYIYKPGNATYLTATYSEKGFGFTLAGKRIDNMSFRSDRTANLNSLIINYLPALTKYHTYILATIYPYASQPNGEYDAQAELFFHLKPESSLGGKYGTDVTINYSRAQAIDETATGDDIGYKSDFFKTGSEIYYEDLNIEIAHKWNKNLRSIFSFIAINYNKNIIEGKTGYGNVYSYTGVIETIWKINSKNSLRTELQHLATGKNYLFSPSPVGHEDLDKGNWALALAEYSVSPHWFFAAYDEYNYGNSDATQRFHYYTGTFGYTRNTNRIQLGYGRQRAGILCVGGVCRLVPASNGVTLSVTSSF